MLSRTGFKTLVLLPAFMSLPGPCVSQDLFDRGRTLRLSQVTELVPSGSQRYHTDWVRGSVARVAGDSVFLRPEPGAEAHPFLIYPTSLLKPVPNSPDDPIGRPVRLRLTDGTELVVGDESHSGSFTGLLAGVGQDSLRVVATRGSGTVALERASIEEAELQWGDPAAKGLRSGAAVGAGLGLVVALLTGEIGVPLAGAAIGAPIGLMVGSIRGGSWKPMGPNR